MLRHIVLFKLKDEYKDKANLMVKLFLDMKDKIDEVYDLHAGTDFLHSERSYDVALIVDLKQKDKLKIYAEHESHVAVLKQIKEFILKSKTVDYEY